MPNLELNFNPNHYQLIGETIDGYLDPEIKTYLKVTVRSAGGQMVMMLYFIQLCIVEMME